MTNLDVSRYYASRSLRFVNYLLDYFFICLLYYPSLLVWVVVDHYLGAQRSEVYYGLLVAIGALVYFLAYYIVCELVWQRTLAKVITGTMVVDADDGGRPTLKQIVSRSFSRIIPMEGVSYFGSNVGLHDKLSDTVVVRTKEFKQALITD